MIGDDISMQYVWDSPVKRRDPFKFSKYEIVELLYFSTMLTFVLLWWPASLGIST